jgi:hypothetical protein
MRSKKGRSFVGGSGGANSALMKQAIHKRRMSKREERAKSMFSALTLQYGFLRLEILSLASKAVRSF